MQVRDSRRLHAQWVLRTSRSSVVGIRVGLFVHSTMDFLFANLCEVGSKFAKTSVNHATNDTRPRTPLARSQHSKLARQKTGCCFHVCAAHGLHGRGKSTAFSRSIPKTSKRAHQNCPTCQVLAQNQKRIDLHRETHTCCRSPQS